MFNRAEKKSQIPVNLLCFVLIVTSLPTSLSQISNVTQAGIQTFQNPESQVSSEILKACVQDLSYYDHNDFSPDALQQKNNIAEGKIEKIDPAMLMKPKDCKNDDVFRNRIDFNTDGTEKLIKLDDGLFGWDAMSSYYYRYKIDWMTIYISFIAMFIALLFSAIKTGKIIFEIAFNGIFLLFTAPLDLTVGQRIKKCVLEILSLFLVLVCICLVFRLYIFGVAWVSGTFDGLSKAICLLGFSWGMIDAPNIIQKILGIDAGLSSGFRTMASMYYAGRTAAGVVKGTADVAKKAAHAGMATTGYTAGVVKGVHDYHKSKGNNQTNQEPSNNHSWGQYRTSFSSKRSELSEKDKQELPGGNSDLINPSDHLTPDNPEPDMPPSGTSPSPESDGSGGGTPTMDKEPQKQTDGIQSQINKERSERSEPDKNTKAGRQKDYTTTLGDVVKSKMQGGSGLLGKSFDIGRNTATKNLQIRDDFINKLSKRSNDNPAYTVYPAPPSGNGGTRPKSNDIINVSEEPRNTKANSLTSGVPPVTKKGRKNHDKNQ